MFARDEELLKNESWAILVDSSLSLGGLAKHLRSVALCVAETAKDIIGRNPWGMFAFSDDLLCIKDFSEPYDSLAKSRIGGLIPDGLSHIPDALRLGSNLVLEHAKDRNYVILVSDGLPSGYSGIEREMATAVKELYSHGVTLAAIGVGGAGRIKKSVANTKVVGEPAEMARAFSELYFALSS
jgi:nitric oxide reductase activation protein